MIIIFVPHLQFDASFTEMIKHLGYGKHEALQDSDTENTSSRMLQRNGQELHWEGAFSLEHRLSFPRSL
jgi:hypothetical protein